MSQEQNYSQKNQTGAKQGAAATDAEKKASMRKAINSDIIASIVSIAIIFVFGIAGGLICYGGYWVVAMIVKSNKPTTTKVILSILAVVVCLALLFAVIVLSAAMSIGGQP